MESPKLINYLTYMCGSCSCSLPIYHAWFLKNIPGHSSYLESHLVFILSLGLLSLPIPSFSGICKVRKFLLNLSVKCWNSAFNAQGSRVIIVVLQRGVKIYVAAVEALSKMERQDETQFTTKIGGKISLGPNYFVL